MAASSRNTLHHADSQTNTLGPGIGGDEPSDGGDLDAAKRGGFNFDEF